MNERQGVGCVVALIVFNAVVMGLVALTFAGGPYSSARQEYWYRYGSLGFFLAGAIFPAIALALRAGRSTLLQYLLCGWMFAALIGWCWYLMMSGGGV